MQTLLPVPQGRPQTRILTPALLSSLLSFGATTAGIAQALPETTEVPGLAPFPPATTFYDVREIPTAPWLPTSTPATPDWLDTGYSPSPLLRPGLGTAAIGDNLIPSARGAGQRRTQGTPFPVGPIDVGFDVSYGLTYGTGLLAGPNREEDSFRHSLTPGLNIYAGDRWSLRYAPSATFYSADGYKDTFDHLVNLAGSATAPGWVFGLNHVTSISSQPLIETGRQTDQTLHSSGLSGNWTPNDRDAFSFSLSQSIRFADDAPDSYSWLSQNWYDRTLTDRISAGIGLGAGYDFLDPGTDMVPVRLNGRLQGSLGTKFSYTVSGGAERREFLDGDASANISPLVSVSLTYQVFEKTSVFVGFDHSVDISYFNNQFTENSSLQGGVNYNFSQKWSVSALGGFRDTSYLSTEVSDQVGREDNSTFANLTISWRILKRLTTALTYSFRANSSDQAGFDFDSHQVGLRITYFL
ncbi:MAG: outer membrane beta-barrel protein [Limisphaerales bacterium]